MKYDKEKLLFRKIKKLNFIVKSKYNDKIDEEKFKWLLNDCDKDIKGLLDFIGNFDRERFDEVYGLKDQFVKLSNFEKIISKNLNERKNSTEIIVKFQKLLVDLNNKLYFYKEEPLVKHFKAIYEKLQYLYEHLPDNYKEGLKSAYRELEKE